jgi:hypothetical protein
MTRGWSMIRALSMASACTDVASLLYADDANALSFTPMVCKVDGLHPHLAQQMADGISPKVVMVFHPKEGELQCRRRTAGTPGHQAASPLTRSASSTQRSVPGRRIMAGTRAKALAKMQAAHWRPLLSCSSRRQRSDCSWFRPSSIPRSCMARKCGHDEGGQRQDVSGRKESSPQHSSPASPRLLF